ncbi:MAG: PepSY domain-containing protein [Acidithiobacillus sp.]|uniref:PepSY domain-containing protein n=1 Tax=Acidithiobacillus sp. TaxID=1872118 RepID=UPI0025C268AE|nr:PepSY domain-containing protein [Acidithiobacillus sp.]
MKKQLIVGLFLASLVASGTAMAFKGEQFSKEAKVSVEEAKAIALKTFPGQIEDVELEKEAGGSGLRYSFDIRKGKVVHEVGVDAVTGKVLENSVDDGKD